MGENIYVCMRLLFSVLFVTTYIHTYKHIQLQTFYHAAVSPGRVPGTGQGLRGVRPEIRDPFLRPWLEDMEEVRSRHHRLIDTTSLYF